MPRIRKAKPASKLPNWSVCSTGFRVKYAIFVNGMRSEPLIIYPFSHDFFFPITALQLAVLLFYSFDQRVLHKTNTIACRNSTVFPRPSRGASSLWTNAGGLLALHGLSETILTYKIAFLSILIHLFQKKSITSMPRMLFLLSMQSLIQFETKERK